jgi:PKD repeat protein
MSADEYVIAGASTTISAQVMDLNDSVLTYYWDFNSDGIVDLTGTESSVSRIFDSTGTQIITLVVRDPSNESDTASVVINVVDESKRVIYIPGDTIVDYESEVVCSVKVLGFFNDLTVEVDTSNSGDFFELEMNRLTGVYRFNPGDACQWDSVKIRIRDEDGFSVDTGFDVAIRPRQVALLSIDSTDTSITVNFKKTSESDFVEYRIYRNLTMNVDTSSELWATITDPMQTSKTSEIASYAWQPKYYRVYQLDSEGLLSEAGAAVYGVIRNSAPSAPEILEPLQDSAVMWTNSRILWTKSRDKNDSPVFYRVSIDSGNGFFTLIDELEDTSTFLHEISNAIISIRVEAYDNFGAVSASERTGIRVPDISRMRIIPGGSFINDKGTFVGIGSSFYMESHEVTYGLYNYITGESRGSGVSPDKPVQATFYDAIKFCNMRSDSEGLQRFYYYDSISSDTVYNLHLFTNRNGYRLPEENQWELAAHGGVQAQWPTYDGNIGPDKANYASDTSVDVASYPPNPYGVYDMAGNAAEWCWDEIGGNRSLRGGNYTDTDEANLKAARKLSAPPKTNQLYIGFRCIREL